MAHRLGVFLDESSTDCGGPVAVVAGLLFTPDGFTWLDVEWKKALDECRLTGIHMRTIQKDLKGISKPDRLKLFTNLAAAINSNKGWSLEASLDAVDHKKYFGWLGDNMWSMYAVCYLMTAISVGKQLEAEKYPYEVPFVIDDGNRYRPQVEWVHKHLIDEFPHPLCIGSLDFGTDATSRHLQAADIVAWAVRRKRAGDAFHDYMEPLESILTVEHLDRRFEPEWMEEISNAIRHDRR